MFGPSPFVNAFRGTPTGSFRYQTSQAGIALPLVYGTTRIAPNLLEGFGFAGGGGKGGKGGTGGGGKKQASYTVDVAFGICRGPVAFTGSPLTSGGPNLVWSNGGAATINVVGLNAYNGSDGQNADPTFVSQDPNGPAIGYSGVAYTTGTPLQMGSSPVLPNMNFEISGFGTVAAGGAGCGATYPADANPSFIITDVLTNARYGAGFPSANLDSAGSLADFANYCQAAQLPMSLLLDRPQPTARWIDEICDLTVAAAVWSGALLKIIPYTITSYSANGATWTPNLTVQYSVDDDDFIPFDGGERGSDGGGSDPVLIERVDPAALPNWLSLEYYDRGNNYNPNVVYAFDQAAIDTIGAVRQDATKSAHEFVYAGVAQAAAYLQLARKQGIRNTFKFQLDWRFLLLEPMDIIEITDGYAGLFGVPVRITSISESDNGELSFEAEEVPNLPAGITPASAVQDSAGAPLDLFATPPNVNAPAIFEPPPALTGGIPELWIAASGGTNWGGCNIFVSTDGVTYSAQPIGVIYGGAPQGVLTATLPTYGGANPDTTDTLAVDLTESDASLASVSSANAANFVSLCLVNNELIAYQTATLTAANKYNLTTLYRGAYGTPIGSHASTAPFVLLGLQQNQQVLRYHYPSNLIGATISLKLQSFNEFLNEPQDLSGLSPYTYTLTGAGSVSPVNIPWQSNGNLVSGSPTVNYTFGTTDNFPLNLTGSAASANSSSWAGVIFDIAKNASNFATLTFAVNATSGTYAGSAETFAPTDILTITPRTSVSGVQFTGNLAGTT